MNIRAVLLCASAVLVAAPATPQTSPTRASAAALCWNTGTIPPAAWNARILVSFLVGRDGWPRSDTIRMELAEPDRAIGTLVFPSASRAILRCAILMPKEGQAAAVRLLFSVREGVSELGPYDPAPFD